jgi:hypothetical protein
MAPRNAFILLCLACLLPSIACNEKALSAREGRILFSVREAYPYGEEGVEPSIFLDLETEKIYGCCNFSIESVFRRIGDRLLVGVEGIYRPELCLTALGPAYSARELDLDVGSYTLEISDGPLRSEFLVEVTDDALTVTAAAPAPGLPSPGLAVPKFSSWWRYPKNSFVYLCGTTEEFAWVYDDFLSQLRAAAGLREIEFPATGELGYPRAPEGHHVDHPARFFVYDDEARFAAAGVALEAYVRDVIGPMSGTSIWLRDWKNRSYRSWLMN